MVHEDVMTRRDEKNDPATPEGLFEALRGEDWGRRPPPVESWHPAREGEIDIRIARDGSWTYLGSPIGRQRMVRLFSTILRRDEDDAFYLVTPAEKLRIQVEDAPFLAVEMAVEDAGETQRLVFRTNVNDVVTADAQHPIRVTVDPATAEPAPYVTVRGRLQALIARSVFYDLVDLAVPETTAEGEMLVVRSAGCRFVLGPMPDETREG